EARRFLDGGHLVDRLIQLILDEAVRPGDADGVHALAGTEPEDERSSVVGLLLVAGAGSHFHLRANPGLQVLHAGERNLDPVAGVGCGVTVEEDFAAAANAGALQAAGAIEIHRYRRLRIGRGAASLLESGGFIE